MSVIFHLLSRLFSFSACFVYITSRNGLEVAKAGQISDRYNGMMADKYLRDQYIGIMADRLDSERLRGFL